MRTPLVRERSTVQSCPAAPPFPRQAETEPDPTRQHSVGEPLDFVRVPFRSRPLALALFCGGRRP